MIQELLQTLSKVPQPRKEDELWLKASTPTREDKEIVVVKIAPSKMFDAFAEEYTSTIDDFFVGPFAANRPNIVDNIAFAVNSEEEKYTEEKIISSYLKTILWASIATNKRKYCKEADLKDLVKHIQTQRTCCPVLAINAINCVGPVDIAEKAMRLEVEFIDKWKYNDEILTKKQMVAVSSWFESLMKHGFDCVEYVKLGADGFRDFMLMTLETSQQPSTSKNAWDDETFVIRSEKIAANIVALFRYFFYNEPVKYLSDSRRIFKFGNYAATEATMRSIVRTMLKVDVEQIFVKGRSETTSNASELIKTEEQSVDSETV